MVETKKNIMDWYKIFEICYAIFAVILCVFVAFYIIDSEIKYSKKIKESKKNKSINSFKK